MSMDSRPSLFIIYTVSSISGVTILRQFLPKVSFPLHDGIRVNIGPIAWITVGTLLYAASFVVWMGILRLVPLASAYPAAFGLTACGAALASAFVLHERVYFVQSIGMCLILAGVFLVLRR
jgi:drug/metabolite transporter (DMT)-like permease